MPLSPHKKRETKTTENPRALCFFWGNPGLIQGLTTFCRFLSQKIGIDFFVVTESRLSCPLFLKEGIQAFSLEQIIDVTPDDFQLPVTSTELSDLLRFDIEKETFKRASGKTIHLPTYAQQVLNAYGSLAEILLPDLAFVWNGCNLWQGALAHVARHYKIPCFFMERGLLPDTFAVDPIGVNYGSSLAGDRWKQTNAPEPTPQEEILVKEHCESINKSRSTIVAHGEHLEPVEARKRLEIPTDAAIILFPLQIETDSNILFYSPLYKSMPDVIRDIQKVLQGYNNVYLVIKPHPEDKNRLNELESLCCEKSRLSRDLSLPTLLELADVVTVINSTVGLEALIYGKPVVILGKAIYGQKGFSFDVETRTDLKIAINQALEAARKKLGLAPELKRFLVLLLKQHLFSLTDTDQWKSRKIIGKMLSDCIQHQETKPVPKNSPFLNILMEQNRHLKNILDQQENQIILFLTSDKAATTIKNHWFESCQIFDYPNDIGKIKLLINYFKSFDVKITEKKSYIGWKGVICKILWRLIRAKKKISL